MAGGTGDRERFYLETLQRYKLACCKEFGPLMVFTHKHSAESTDD